jgi:LuxR family maltose regulon positive regulatory protein
MVAALAALARALYFDGSFEQAWSAASRAVEYPEAARRAPAYALARATLAVLAAEGDRLHPARTHAEAARAVVGRIASSRSWLGANAAEALGTVLAAEGDLAGAERELSHAERFVGDDVATVHHARLLLRLADVRCRRGRVDEAEATLAAAREELAELADSGIVGSLAAGAADAIQEARRQASSGAILELPSDAELAVLRLLTTDLSAREIGAKLFLSPNTVRSHTRSIYRKLRVGSREDAVAAAQAAGLLRERDHPGDRSALA